MRKFSWVTLIIAGFMVFMLAGCGEKSDEKGIAGKAMDQVKETTQAAADKTAEVAKEATESATETV